MCKTPKRLQAGSLWPRSKLRSLAGTRLILNGESKMKRVGLIGWRGMVGSVLMDRMRQENDFDTFLPMFFSTSQVGAAAPDVGQGPQNLADAHDIGILSDLDVVVTCQGGDYTSQVHPKLRETGWAGFWIDAASSLRMSDHSVIVLDPVNRQLIDQGIDTGIKDYIGGNCTVSLMLMGLEGLFKRGFVQWMSTMTYQSASGAGAKNMIELVDQMDSIGKCRSAGQSALELERLVTAKMNSGDMPCDQFGVPLAGSLIPWIDRCMNNGQTREEWKGQSETNKILGYTGQKTIPIDGQCVRVGAMRCHSQAITIKLTRDVPIAEIEATIAESNDWAEFIPNDREITCHQLTPTAVSGKMHVPVGRIRKMTIGPEYLTCFTVGDQLLWGAAEPLRRTLQILLGNL